MVSIPSQHAKRLSSALDTTVRPTSMNGSSITMKSPTRTFFLTSFTSIPRSTKNSLTSGTLVRSSWVEMCSGRPAGFITPFRSPLSVHSSTRRENRFRGSNPPAGFRYTNPLSLMCDT